MEQWGRLLGHLDKGDSKRRVLNQLLGDAPNATTLEKAAATAIYFARYYEDPRPRRYATRSLAAFTLGRVIGQGAFGVVHLGEYRGEVVAIKQLRKRDLLRMGQEGHILAERDILVSAASATWIPRLHCSFQDGESLFLVLEYCGGGDLLTLLMDRGCLPEWVVRFYAAQMILALGEVHALGYIHRDVKPDNLLFDAEGRLRIADFGLATDLHWRHDSAWYERVRRGVVGRFYSLPAASFGNKRRGRRRLAYTVCGTNSYMAPEVIRGKGYGFSADWWGVGVIVYEALFGAVPFTAGTRDAARAKILDWKTHLSFPKDVVSPLAVDFIKALLCEPEDRLGFLPGEDLAADGIQQLQQHAWFAGLDWDTLHLQTPPYRPNLLSDDDTRHFDKDIPNEPLPPAAGAMRVRDPLLEDLDYGPQVMAIRKRLCFLGWEFSPEPNTQPNIPPSPDAQSELDVHGVWDPPGEFLDMQAEDSSDDELPPERQLVHWADILMDRGHRVAYDARWDQRFDPVKKLHRAPSCDFTPRSSYDASTVSSTTPTLRGGNRVVHIDTDIDTDTINLDAINRQALQATLHRRARAGTLRTKVKRLSVL